MGRKYRSKLKLEVLQHYSGKKIPECICCGEQTYEFLSIDHINNCGSKKRESRTGYFAYQWLRKNNYPPGYQVMCQNCNLMKGRNKFRFCPEHHPELYPTVTEKYVRPENKCEICGNPMPLKMWIKSGLQRKTCSKKCNRIRLNKLSILRHVYYKDVCFEHYGNKCACCGTPFGLTIDHIIRAIHCKSKERIKTGVRLYRWLVTHNFPEGYQLICMNCNHEKRYYDKPFCKVHHPELY